MLRNFKKDGSSRRRVLAVLAAAGPEPVADVADGASHLAGTIALGSKPGLIKAANTGA